SVRSRDVPPGGYEPASFRARLHEGSRVDTRAVRRGGARRGGPAHARGIAGGSQGDFPGVGARDTRVTQAVLPPTGGDPAANVSGAFRPERGVDMKRRSWGIALVVAIGVASLVGTVVAP